MRCKRSTPREHATKDRRRGATVRCAHHRGKASAYEAAGADLVASRRSSIRSRSTSQYLSAESRSLSGWSIRRDSSMVPVSCSRSFAALSSLRLDFVLRHRPRRRRPAPVTIVSSFVLFACTSHHNSGMVATTAPDPSSTLRGRQCAKSRLMSIGTLS